MQGGDIDNRVVPRLVIVWEGLLGLLPGKVDEAKFSTALRLRRYQTAADAFTLNEVLAQRLWDIVFRLDYNMDLFTFVGGEKFAEALARRVERDDLPLGHVRYENPEHLVRKLAYMPQIAAIYHAHPSLALTFGSKGRLIAPSRPDLLGVL